VALSSPWETLLERLWLRPNLFSRNKNFDLYDGIDGRRALRAYRLLRSLKRDLLESSEIEVSTGDGSTSIWIALRAIHGQRRVRLTPLMYQLLRDDPDVGARLRAARDRGDAAPRGAAGS
jgi:hypothetical protein